MGWSQGHIEGAIAGIDELLVVGAVEFVIIIQNLHRFSHRWHEFDLFIFNNAN